MNYVLEASSKAEPEVIDEVSPEETVEEDLDLNANFKDDIKHQDNSEIDLNESPIIDKVETRYKYSSLLYNQMQNGGWFSWKLKMLDRRKIISASKSDMRNEVTTVMKKSWLWKF